MALFQSKRPSEWRKIKRISAIFDSEDAEKERVHPKKGYGRKYDSALLRPRIGYAAYFGSQDDGGQGQNAIYYNH